KDGRILDLITLETGYNEEIITPSHINAWLQVKGGLKDFIPAFDPTTALELLDALAAARAEAERWKRRHDALRAAVIKADALIVDAIQRATVMYNHTQDDDYASRSDGLDEALMILRQLLAEAGGGVQ